MASGQLCSSSGSLTASCSPRVQQLCSLIPRPFAPRRLQARRGALSVVNMKKNLHPEYYEEAKVFCNGQEVLTVSGTQEKYTVDVWSGNHPFFQGTGGSVINDEGRVSRFNKRFGGLESSLGAVSSSKGGDKKLEYKPAGKAVKGKGGKKK